MSEECETGEQGGLTVDLYSLVRFTAGTLVLVTVESNHLSFDELPTAKAASAVSMWAFSLVTARSCEVGK